MAWWKFYFSHISIDIVYFCLWYPCHTKSKNVHPLLTTDVAIVYYRLNDNALSTLFMVDCICRQIMVEEDIYTFLIGTLGNSAHYYYSFSIAVHVFIVL